MKMDIKILLVEDNHVTSFLSTTILKVLGFKNIDSAENGLEAYTYIKKNCPDLIFLDLNMPVMNGFEFMALNKKEGTCIKTHIAILTSSVRPIDKIEAANYNVIDYVEKPLNSRKVNRVLEKMKDKNW